MLRQVLVLDGIQKQLRTDFYMNWMSSLCLGSSSHRRLASVSTYLLYFTKPDVLSKELEEGLRYTQPTRSES